MKSEAVTLVLVNLAGIMKQADESLLPGVYKEVGKALHTDPTGLGSLTLFRSLVESSCYPLAAYLSLRYNRAHIIALGAFLWAAATFLVAISSTFLQVAISRGLNGIGLAIVTPAIQSLVADSTNETNRGMAFGWLQLTGNLGSIIGGLSSVLIASTSFAGIPGWRLSFHLVALISVLVGTLVYLFANDPLYSDTRNEKTPQHKPTTSFCSEMRNLMKQAKSVVGIPTFQIIVVQGVPGSFPGFALSFAPLWLELSGFSHVTTGLLWTLFVLALSFGSLFGGWLGDKFAKRLPSCGRIVLAQISAGSMIPLAAILLLGLRADPSTTFLHGLVLIVMGLTTSWCAPATNNPIFAEIVPEKSRTCIYALDRFFETMLASFAPPVVGILAQHVYGYKPIPKGSSNTQEIETDRENAASLAKALYTAICIPRAMCVFLYSFLYCTYTRDKERARMVSMVESEMQKLKVEEEEEGEGVRELSEECCKFHDSESNEVNAEEGIMFDIDDSDEKSLLSSGLAR